MPDLKTDSPLTLSLPHLFPLNSSRCSGLRNVQEDLTHRNIIEKEWAVAPEVMNLKESEMRALESHLNRCLCDLQSVFRAGGRDPLSRLRRLGISEELAKIYTSTGQEDLNGVFRFDLILTPDGQAKIIEVNAGTNMGGLNLVLPDSYVAPEHSVLHPLDFIKASLETRLCPNVPSIQLFVTEDDDSFEDVKSQIRAFSQLNDERIQVTCGPVSSFSSWQNDRSTEALGLIYPYFVPSDLTRKPARYRHLLETLRQGQVSFAFPLLNNILGNKNLLPELRKRWQREHGPVSILPETLECTSEVVRHHNVISSQKRWVLKPSDGYGGQGITIGAAVEQKTWKRAVSHAIELGTTENSYILQELVPSFKRCPSHSGPSCFSFVNERRAQHSVVWSVFMIGQKIAGSLYRSAPGSQEIVNAANGASVGFVSFRKDLKRGH